jgi:hypothetical protein
MALSGSSGTCAPAPVFEARARPLAAAASRRGGAHMSRWLLALHSSSPVLGVGLLDRAGRPEAPARGLAQPAFPLGGASPTSCSPASRRCCRLREWSPSWRGWRWPWVRAGFTGTRLTVVLARSPGPAAAGAPRWRQQLCVLMAAAAGRSEPNPPGWCQTLPRRGVVAGLYAPDAGRPGRPDGAGGAAACSPTWHSRCRAGPQCRRGRADALPMWPSSLDARRCPWRPMLPRRPLPGRRVLPLYPTSPVLSG